jgi:pimeloyl-ACP methyl ester carboxylesterase
MPATDLLQGALAPGRGAALIEMRHPPRGLFAPVPGGRLHALHRRPPGACDGPAVVLLHGASGNACDLGLDLFDALSRRFRTLSIDRPGHGWSDRPGGAADADPARQAALIREALAGLGVREALIVAHSWSGGLALHMALDHADLVRGVVLVAAATHPWPGGRIAWHQNLAAHPTIGPRFAQIAPAARMVLDHAVRGVFAPQTPPPDFVERTALPLLFRPSQFRANAQDMAGLHGFLSAQAHRYGALAVPVTAIVSDGDRVVPMAHGLTLARQSRRVRLVRLRGLGHMLQHAAVPEVVEAVEEIAERIPAREARAPAVAAPA